MVKRKMKRFLPKLALNFVNNNVLKMLNSPLPLEAKENDAFTPVAHL